MQTAKGPENGRSRLAVGRRTVRSSRTVKEAPRSATDPAVIRSAIPTPCMAGGESGSTVICRTIARDAGMLRCRQTRVPRGSLSQPRSWDSSADSTSSGSGLTLAQTVMRQNRTCVLARIYNTSVHVRTVLAPNCVLPFGLPMLRSFRKKGALGAPAPLRNILQLYTVVFY